MYLVIEFLDFGVLSNGTLFATWHIGYKSTAFQCFILLCLKYLRYLSFWMELLFREELEVKDSASF